MTKKLSLLFFICFLSTLNINAEVYEGSCGTNVRYSLDTETGVLKVTGTGSMDYFYFKDGSINTPWYSNRSYIKLIEISNGVTSIGNCAFYGCSGLTSITIGNSVTEIEYSAFSGCSGLTKVTINSNAIVSKSYNSHSSLKSIFGSQVKEYYIGEGVTTIGQWAFHECYSLTSITIPNSVKSIEKGAFYNCTGLTSVTIPYGVTSIVGSAFYGCSGLTSVTIPASVTSLEGAFTSCPSLTKVILNN
jgi:hypothetical protein